MELGVKGCEKLQDINKCWPRCLPQGWTLAEDASCTSTCVEWDAAQVEAGGATCSAWDTPEKSRILGYVKKEAETSMIVDLTKRAQNCL